MLASVRVQANIPDEATAHSAVRNLQDVPINGRPVRIELSTDDGGRRGARPTPFGRHREASPPRGAFGAAAVAQPIDYSQLPQGIDPPPGQKATDAISKTLAEINPGQMQEVMAGMKVC
jgi:cleavage stimulation factor subunit 2